MHGSTAVLFAARARRRLATAYLGVVIIFPRDKVRGSSVVETRIVVIGGPISKDPSAGCKASWSLVILEKVKGPQIFRSESPPTKSKGCPNSHPSPTSPDSRPNTTSNRGGGGGVRAICTPKVDTANMLSHNGNSHSSTRGLQPSSTTPVRRRRRTTHGHSHGHGPDARSCSHCGRTFKRTEHLERHVRTRQSSIPFYVVSDAGVKSATD